MNLESKSPGKKVTLTGTLTVPEGKRQLNTACKVHAELSSMGFELSDVVESTLFQDTQYSIRIKQNSRYSIGKDMLSLHTKLGYKGHDYFPSTSEKVALTLSCTDDFKEKRKAHDPKSIHFDFVKETVTIMF